MARTHPWRRTPSADDTTDTTTDTTASDTPATTLAVADRPDGTSIEEATVGDASGRDGGVRPAPRRGLTPWWLLVAAHPRQGVATAALVALGAGLSGRSAREVALVLVTVLVGQAVLGWHNDLVDRGRDETHHAAHKPAADGRLDAGTLSFSLVCALLVLVPLSVSGGIVAGCCYLASVLVGLAGNLWPRRGLLSFVPWAVGFALYPFVITYGSWGGGSLDDGRAPEVAVVVLAALLGIGVHVLCALWGLLADDAEGWTYLPLRLGRRWGTSRLLAVTVGYLAVVLVALGLVVNAVGWSR